MGKSLKEKSWWNYVEKDIRGLLIEAYTLKDFASNFDEKFHDYAFVIFPAAKAYEGFLKKVFLDLGFISEEEYFGRRFRVGKALNPQLDKCIRHESVYDKLVDYCNDSRVADQLWKTWKQSRNLVFHWFPKEKNAINLKEAGERLEMIISAMDAVFKECKIR